MASDYRDFVGYSLDELEEIFPDYAADDRFAAITYRPYDVQTIFVPNNEDCPYVGIEYWDGQIAISDGSTLQEVTFEELFYKLS